MRNVVMRDMKDYVRNHGRLIAVSVAAALLCFGFLAFNDNVRVDTEELINHPGTTVGWLTIGRYGLAFLKRILGLRVHKVFWSAFLFFVFFLLGANLLTFEIYHFSGKRERYSYWIFLLLYVTSNIWCYQLYFSLQQAEVACAMFLLVVAAMLTMRACFEEKGAANLLRFLAATVFMVIGLGAYQALAVYYIVICMILFLVHLEAQAFSYRKSEEAVQKKQNRRLLLGIVELLVQFGISYAIYYVIANTWFMAAADYMESQMGWGRLPVAECVKNVLRTAKNILLGYGPRNFSFYTIGILLVVFLALKICRERKTADEMWPGLRFVLYLLALAGIVAAPFFMTIYMGEMLVTRSQFALPVTAAFLGMYGIGALREPGMEPEEKRRKGVLLLCKICVWIALVLQCGYDFRLAYTDEVRYRQDTEKTEELLRMLREENDGILPEQPVIFVGFQEMEPEGLCRRTEMYGWSFYEWDYSTAQPTGATHRIVGLAQACTGNVLRENATEEQRERAVEMAETMTDFPKAGSVQVTEEFVVIRLSEVRERTDLDWW